MSINEVEKSLQKYRVFIGGNDLEMQTIRELLVDRNISVIDQNLGWGAKASAYNEEITQAVKEGYVPVFIELDPDIEVPLGAIVINHHGSEANKPASVFQVCELLGIEPDREIQKVAWNDSGWIPKLREMGATNDEIAEIRLKDRNMQGFDDELEEKSAELADTAEVVPELGLAVVKDLPISRFAGIKDRIALEKDVYNIICLALPQGDNKNGEMEFQGDGAICAELAKKYNGWSGGDGLGKASGTAYWGGYPDNPQTIINFIKKHLRSEMA